MYVMASSQLVQVEGSLCVFVINMNNIHVICTDIISSAALHRLLCY